MLRAVSSLIVLSFLATSIIAQDNPKIDINISGTVTDTDKKAISGATVTLEKSNLSSKTDNKGSFSLKYDVPLTASQYSLVLPGDFTAAIRNSFLSIHIPDRSDVIITAYSLSGKVLSKMTKNLVRGTHKIAILPTSTGVDLYKIKSGNNEIVLKRFTSGNNTWERVDPVSNAKVLNKEALVAATFTDKLMVAKNGYHNYSMNIDNPKMSGINIQLKLKTTTPPPEGEKVIGWASVSDCGPNGITGGAGGETVTVTDGAALKAAMNSSDPKIIYVSGRIKTPGNFSGRKNKTLIGINNAEIYGGSGLVVCKNIIVKNIKFSDGPNDSFGLSGSTCIWIDHCEFVDGADGCLDIVNGSDFVTVSWCKFYYTKGHGHMLACLVGNTQPNASDVGKQRITFHHNWWGAGIKSRQPRVRYGRVHVFNNYYKYEKVSGDAGSNYAIGGGFESKLLVENNYFEKIGSAFTYMGDNGTAQVVAKGNVGGSVPNRGSSFKPPYSYTLESAEEAKASVMKSAGVQ